MEINKQPINISITTGAIIKIVLIFLALYFLFIIKDILVILFISLVLASAIDPWVGRMQKLKIPRSIGIFVIYLILFSVIGLTIYLIVPPISEQVGELTNNFPRYSEKIISIFSALKNYSIQHGVLEQVKNSLSMVSSNLQTMAGSIFSTVTGIFGGVFSFFLVLVLTFYMVAGKRAIKKLIRSITPKEREPYVMNLITRIQKKIGLWISGQMILCLFIFVLTYLGLFFLNVKYALILALVAGLTEFVPYLGPILGAIPAILLAFMQAPMLGLFVFILYSVVQLFENNILVPKVMEKTVGINPIISITALLIGFKIAGIMGAILSIPVAVVVSIFVKDIFNSKNGEEKVVEKN
ncbi:MAG: AI-2E family transporter [Patescibacteria group bacterium]